MKKILSLALMSLSILVSGCKSSIEKQQAVYVKGDYLTWEKTVEVKGNELYDFVCNSVAELNKKYSKTVTMEENDAVALEEYDAAVADNKKLKDDFDAKIASGTDFGYCAFIGNLCYRVSKNDKVLKESERVEFSYSSNVRIDNEDSILLDTSTYDSVIGFTRIKIMDAEIDCTIKGFKIYNEDRTAATVSFIKKVEAVKENGATLFKVYFEARKGVELGKYYMLVTFTEQAGDFDYVIHLEHI